MSTKYDELAVALFDGDLKQARNMLESGADPNKVLPGGNTLMRGAAQSSHLGAIKLLLKYGADPNRRTRYRSPVDGRIERDYTALFYAGSPAVVKLLVDHGADVNATAAHGLTALILRSMRANAPLVRALLKCGADSKRVANLDGLGAVTAIQMAAHAVKVRERLLKREESKGMLELLNEAKACYRALAKHEGI